MMREDLDAQLAPLDRYGMVEPIALAVDGLRMLAQALADALRQAVRQSPGVSAHCGCQG